MKRLLLALILVILMLPVGVQAQGDAPSVTIAYGDTVSGEITNRTFENLYYFRGKEGDLVAISMTALSDELDPELLLTTTDNEILVSNDDSYGLNSRIIYKLPEDGIYQIVAQRLGGRTGGSVGEYELSLAEIQQAQLDTIIEGRVEANGSPTPHIFIPEEAGIYEITYRHIRGDYYPSFEVNHLDDEYGYYYSVGEIYGEELLGASMVVALEADVIYVMSAQESYYYEEGIQDFALYTIEVSLVE